MHRLLPLLLLPLLAAPLHAAEGLYLTWNDCARNGAGQSVLVPDCGSSTPSALYCAMVMPQPTDSVLGAEITIDLQVADSSLPDWWRFDTGGCRDGDLAANVNFSALNACSAVWPNLASSGVLGYTIGMPRGGLNQARIRVGVAVPSNQFVQLNATDMYYVARVVLAGNATCGGCEEPACLVLNSIRIFRPPRPEGVPTSDVVVTAPGLGNGNWAGWQTAAATTCQAVPVRNRTWGAVKSLYR